MCIPINKTGSQSRDFPKMVEAGFASDNHIIMFPAGLCSRRQGGEIKDLEWKKTFVTKSIETHRDVVPLHFEGRNSDFFSIIWQIYVRPLALSLILLCFTWQMKQTLPERRCGNGKPKEKYTDEVLRYGRRKAADRREDEAASHKAVWGILP